MPSFEYFINNKNYGYTKNYLQIKIPELNIINQTFIIIRNPIVKLNTPLFFQYEKNEKIFGVFNKGYPILNASYDKNYCYFNEDIIIKICFNRNNSKFNVKYIQVLLISF